MPNRAWALLVLLSVGCDGPASSDGKTDDSGEDTHVTTEDDCPVAVVSPDTLDFADLALGIPSTLSVTLLNDCDGDENLSIQASVDGAAFSVDPALSSVGAAEVATLTVTATVDDYAQATASLALVTNDPDRPLVTIPLSALAAPDQDGDSHDAAAAGGDDCDDADASVNPVASETWYDGVDQDCDGNDDDQDADGYAADGDCDDTDGAIHPDATETYYDGVDANCDGLSDDDADGDGGDLGDDCDDADAAIFPGNAETWYDGVDADCDGASDYDQDGDGGEADAYGGTDCDDTDASVYYGAPDAWYDAVDSDCAEDSDFDADRDGFDAAAYGYDDCDDADATVAPDADEVWYDGVDQNCDGASDYDQDGDGVAAFDHGGSDCDDTDPSTLSGPAEARNGLDDDCDGYVDEGLASPGDVVITEIMTNPAAVADTSGEWFELYNASSYDIDLYGWVIYSDDGGSITIGSSLTVAAGAYVVLGAEDDASLNGGAHVDYEYTRSSFALSDTEGIYVMSGSTTVTGFEFDSSWPVVEGYAMALDPSQYGDPTDSDNWCVASTGMTGGDYGTPGAANDACPIYESIDTSTLPYVSSTYVYGYAVVSAIGDTDGDGDQDLLFGPNALAYSEVLGLHRTTSAVIVLDGGGYASWAGAVEGLGAASIDVASWRYVRTSTGLGDNTGDGLADVVMAVDAWTSGDLNQWMLFSEPSGSLTTGDATITCTGSVEVFLGQKVFSDVDFDGDGTAEVVYANPADWAYAGVNGGRVDVFDVAGLGGSITSSDAALTVIPTAAGDEVGYTAAAGDVDGDGYADLLVGTDSDGVYVLPGDGLATTGTHTPASLYSIRIADPTSYLVVDDFDGDGADDVVGDGNYVYTGLGDLSGTVTTSDATAHFASTSDTCARYDAHLDMDGDGIRDVPVYCDGASYYDLFFDDAALGSAALDVDDAFVTVDFPSAYSYAYVSFEDDLDGDGSVERIYSAIAGVYEVKTFVDER